MPTDLAAHIAAAPLADTHEHLRSEAEWCTAPGDILSDLFQNYVPADFHSARVDGQAMQRLMNVADPDIAARFEGVRPAWETIQHTGYGEAVSLVAKLCFDVHELTGETLAAAAERAKAYRQPGERLRLLREVGGLSHVQIDNFCWPCPPDESGPEFFLYDLSWCSFANGEFSLAEVEQATGQTISDLESLRAAMASIFAQHAPTAIAVKSQHAYSRTLTWRAQDEADVAHMLAMKCRGEKLCRAELDVLGDWCFAQGIELAIEYHLPVKIHCGYYAGNDRMPVDYIKAGNLCALLAAYPKANFVLMHVAYPYTSEIVALAKHYRNTVVDCCWAWSMNPFQVVRFIREFLHAAPINKLLAFGGDTTWPTSALAYAHQARIWLTRAMQAEVDEGLLTERQAIAVAERVMSRNQEDLFDLEGTRARIRAAMGG